MADGTVETKVPDAAVVAAQTAASVPAMVPDKFKNQDGTVNIESLTQAYRELEQKQSGKVAEVKAAEVKAPEAVNIDEAFKATDAPALWGKAQAEIAADGKVSDATRAELKKAHNADDAMVDSMITGAAAQRALLGTKLAEAAGGADQLKAAIAHAKANLAPAQLAELRKSLETPMGPFIVKGLVAALPKAQVAATRQGEPRSILDMDASNQPPTQEVKPFGSWNEMVGSFQNPKYHTDSAYRELVAKRMLVTQEAQRAARHQ